MAARLAALCLALLLPAVLPSLVSAQTLTLLPKIRTVIGTGVSGETVQSGPAAGSQISAPGQAGFDSQGNVYFGDLGSYLYKIDKKGNLFVLAGNSGVCPTSTASCGDGGPSFAAQFSFPYSITSDRAGNLFIADFVDNRIREISAVTGNVSTLVGTGTPGTLNSTTPVPATTANISRPIGLALDAAGNIYFSDSSNNVIYEYFATGINAGKVAVAVNTSGAAGFTPDGTSGAATQVNGAVGLAVDSAGNLFIADQNNNRIRMLSAATGNVSTVVGNGTAGYTGDGGTAIAAELSDPRFVAFDPAGNLLISDSDNDVVRIVYAVNGLVTTTSQIATLAGTGATCSPSTAACGDGGLAADAQFAANGQNSGGSTLVASDPTTGTTYISDFADYRIRALEPSGNFPATGVAASTTQTVGLQVTGGALSISSFTATTGPAGAAEFTVGTITGCTVDGSTINAVGTICRVPVQFSPAYPGTRSASLKVVTSGGTFYYGVSGVGTSSEAIFGSTEILTDAGTGTAGYTASGTASSSAISAPQHAFVDGQGTLYFASPANNVVQKITGAGVLSTVAGNTTACASSTATCGDGGAATSANLNAPQGVTVDAAGNVYIADTGDNRIRVVTPGGTISTIAGTGATGYTGDAGIATLATLRAPAGVAIDSNGVLYIADTGNNVVRSMNIHGGAINTAAGDGTACSSTTADCGDGAPAFGANLNGPQGVAVDRANDLLIADTGDNRIRLVATGTGVMSTVAGTGNSAYAGDGGAATAATLFAPADVAVDAAGDYYIADTGNHAIRQVMAATGTIATLIGTGVPCTTPTAGCGDLGPANAALLNSPAGVAVDPLGNVFVSDTGDNKVRLALAGLTKVAFAATPVGSTSSDSPKTATLENIGNTPLTLSPPASGSNPSVPVPFLESGSSSCPQLTSASAPATLASGAACSLLVSFSPTMGGSYSGLLIETDNSLNNAASTQTISLSGTATAAASQTALTTSPNPSSYAQNVTFTATVTGPGITPTGTVTFSNGGTTFGTATLDGTGVATLVYNSLPAGTDLITATYSGDASYTASTSSVVSQTVGNPATVASTTTVTSSVNPTVFGQSTTFTATVASTNSGATPTGSVTFYSAGTPTVVNLQATGTSTTLFQTLNLQPGTYSVSILGNTLGGLYTAWNPAANPSTNNRWTDRYGIEMCATCAALVNDISGAPGTSTDTQALSNFQAATLLNLSTSNLAAGQTVNNPYTFTLGSAASVSLYVPDGPFVNGAFTDTTSFADDTGGLSLAVTPLTSLATASLNGAGVASASVTSLPVGTDPVVAVYSGDNTYVASSSSVLNQTVDKANGADTLTTSNAAPAFGTSITLTDTIPVVNGVAPTGTVTFYNGTTAIGTGTVNSSGVATLTTGSLPVGTDTITAVYGGDANYAAVTSNAITETVGKANGADTLTTSNAAPAFGTSITLTDTIPVVNGVAPTGTVTFYNGATAIGTGTVNSSGIATLTIGTLPIGTDSITAVYGGDATYAAVTSNAITETVGKANGADTLTTSNAAPIFGASITLTDTIPVVNGIAPTGTVTFYNGTTAIGTGTVSASGVATLTTGSLPVGSDSITAVYGGDSTYASVTSNAVTVTVGKANGADTLTTSNAAPSFGASITLTDTIPEVNGIAPTGTVTFYNGTTAIGTGTVSASGVATLTTGSLPVGTDTITAVYGGDANYAAVTSNAITETVGKANGADTLTTSNASPAFGNPITLTDTIPVVNGVAPTGAVTFYNGTTAIGTGTVSATGVAALTTGSLPVGTDTITAVYGGDANYAAVTSNAITETVGKANGADVLTTSNAVPAFGVSITLTDTIPVVNGVAPTGTVTFYNGSTAIGTGTVSASGIATLTTGSLPIGTDTITAVYGGDATYAAVTSNAITETVGKANGTDVLTTSNSSPAFGTSITLTDTIPVVNGVAPTGTVTFYNGTTVIGTASISSSGVATLTTGILPIGTDTITAVYSGDATYAAGTSNAVVETVGKANGPDVLTAAPSTLNLGQQVAFTDTVPVVNGVAPTGTVTFFYGTSVLGTGTVNASGIATLTTGSLPVGMDSITAVYGGDATYASVTSNAVTVTVGKGASASTLTTSNATPTFGQSVTFTDTVAPINGLTATGTVTFYDGTTAIGTGTLNTSGVATFSTNSLAVGTHTIGSTYGGDTNFTGSSSNTVTETVAKSGSGTNVLTTSNATPVFGMAVTFTDTLAVVNGVAPTGTVTFYAGTTVFSMGSVGPGGVTTLTTSALPTGVSMITAVYSGDTTYGQATSNAVTETVSKAGGPGVDTLTTSNATPALGDSVTFTDAIPLVGGAAPTGTVTFSVTSDGTTAVLGTGSVNASGVATLATTALPVGTSTVTATYAGDVNYVPSVSNAVTETIVNDFTITATPATQTVDPGQTVPYTVLLAGAGSAFNQPVTLSATGLPPNATVSFNPATVTPGVGPQTTTMTIVTSPSASMRGSQSGGVAYGLLLLPLLGLRRIRRRMQALPKALLYPMACFLLLATASALTGCGGGGYFGHKPATYTIVVTGTSGTIQHSTSVSLTVR